MVLNLKVSEINFLFSLNKLEFSFDFAIFFFLLEELHSVTKIQNLNWKLKKKSNSSCKHHSQSFPKEYSHK